MPTSAKVSFVCSFVCLRCHDSVAFCVLLAFHPLHQRPGGSIRIKDLSLWLDMEEYTNMGIVAGRSSLGLAALSY
jgi:hypothetical protein